jgi:hypothetical protein
MMTYEEAVQLGSNYARDHGYGYRLREAHLSDGHLWRVNFRIFERERWGRLHLEFDAYSRQLVNADERLGRRHGDDDEDDDEEHEHRRRGEGSY